MKTCYLHIGTHKTATTFIQRKVAANRTTLADAGVKVPLPERRLKRHRDLALELRRLRGDAAPSGEWTELSNVLEGEDRHVLLSHEGFSRRFMDPGALDYAKRFFAERGFRLELICFVRDQPAYINSLYAQEVKRFFTADDFATYLSRIRSGELPYYDYWAFFEPLRADPEVTTHFVPFLGRGTDPWAEFVQQLPVDPGTSWDDIPVDSANLNPGTKAIFTARLLNRTLTELGHGGPALFELRRPLKRAGRRRKWSDQAYMGLDRDTTEQVMDHFRDSNERFAKEVWGRSWTDIFEPRTYERSEFDFAGASPDDRAEVLGVYDELLRFAALGEPPGPVRRTRTENRTEGRTRDRAGDRARDRGEPTPSPSAAHRPLPRRAAARARAVARRFRR